MDHTMGVLKRAWSRCLAVFDKDHLDQEFDEEVRSHIALATEDYVQRGMPLPEAQRLARIKFGSLAASKDAHRDSRGLPWLEGFLFDLRLTFRGFRRDRAFAVTTIATLAVAIALNVTVFTVMDAMLFRGLPLATRSDRLVYLGMRKPSDLPCCPGPCCMRISRRGARSPERSKTWHSGAAEVPSPSATATAARST